MIQNKLFRFYKECISLPEGNYLIINNERQYDSEFFSEISCEKYICDDLNELFFEHKQVPIQTISENISILIEDTRFIFLICSNVLKINKLLYDNYISK